MEGSQRNEVILDSLRIVIVQIPFIPIICNPDFNSLYEPDGGINYWWFSEKFENGENFKELVLDDKYHNKIKSFFTDDYETWLELTVKQILEHISHEKNIDVIIFPEYSLPIETNEKIKQMIIDFSNKTCIVAGIGSITSEDISPRKNRFIVAQNNELKYCEKVHPTPEESNYLGIIGGKGPVIHDLWIKRNGNSDIVVPFAVLTCRDYLEKMKLGDPIQIIANEELNEKNLQYDDIKFYLIPSFARNIIDFESLSKMDVKRGPPVVAFVNWTPFGGSCIWCPTPSPDDSKLIKKLGKNTTGYILADIPFMHNTVLKTTTFLNNRNSQKNEYQQVIFKFKYEECELNEIQLETQSIYGLLSERLNYAIEVCGIFLKRSDVDSENNVLPYLLKWKRLQLKIHEQFLKNNPQFLNLSSWDYLSLLDLKQNKNIYLFIMSKLKDHLNDPEHQEKVSEIIEIIKDKHLSDPSSW